MWPKMDGSMEDEEYWKRDWPHSWACCRRFSIDPSQIYTWKIIEAPFMYKLFKLCPERSQKNIIIIEFFYLIDCVIGIQISGHIECSSIKKEIVEILFLVYKIVWIGELYSCRFFSNNSISIRIFCLCLLCNTWWGWLLLLTLSAH